MEIGRSSAIINGSSPSKKSKGLPLVKKARSKYVDIKENRSNT